MTFTTKILKTILLSAILIGVSFTSIPMIGHTHYASALTHSMSVAYVTDASCGVGFGGSGGVEDPHTPLTTGPGCSIFSNAITGAPLPNGGSYTPTGGVATMFTDVPVSAITSVTSLSGFDTVMLYGVCDIGSQPTLVAVLNSYLSSGMGKVVIYDGDLCATGVGGSPNYSTFLFPFASSNPGPLGATGSITLVESESPPAVLTSGISTGLVSGNDAVGDSNTFTSNAGGWCAAIDGTNVLGASGIQEGYARTANGGLAIYNGQDNWFTFGFGTTALQKQVFDNILNQPFNPDSLPCGIPVTGIKLGPLTATNPVGTTHTVTATVTDSSGNPQPGIAVTFTVTGANPTTGTAVTNAAGVATFTYTGANAGTDTIVATFTDSTGGTHKSGSATKIWNVPPRSTTIVTTSSQTGFDIPGTFVSDSATVTGSGTSPFPDLTGTVSYQLCGPNPSASTSLNCAPAGAVPITVPNGGAFTAISPTQAPTAAGSYCWTATYTPSGTVYTGSSSTTTTSECFNVPVSVTQGRMTGGGSVTDPVAGKVTHGFELHCNVSNTPNHLEVNWGTGNHFHLNSLTSVFCINDPSFSPNPPTAAFDTYIGAGTGTLNGKSGATATWTFTDAGEPGTNDHATIVIKDSSGTTVLSVSGNLNHGNQQAHNH